MRASHQGARFPPPTRAEVQSADAFTNLRGKMGTTATFRSEIRTQITVMAIFGSKQNTDKKIGAFLSFICM